MGTEIERKFLVRGETPAGGEAVAMRQAYVALEDDRAVRIRQAGESWRLTVKAGGGMARTEVEVDIDPVSFNELWAVAGDRAVEKTRTRLPLGRGLVAEVDDFAGRHTGLRLVEVEFPSVEAARAFEPPSWFGEDVTDADWASNAWLSMHDLPPDLTR